jgi:hypothetical protein
MMASRCRGLNRSAMVALQHGSQRVNVCQLDQMNNTMHFTSDSADYVQQSLTH